jgi:hypothetical protein
VRAGGGWSMALARGVVLQYLIASKRFIAILDVTLPKLRPVNQVKCVLLNVFIECELLKLFALSDL